MRKDQRRGGGLPGLAPHIRSRFRKISFSFSCGGSAVSVHDKRLGRLARVGVTPFPPSPYSLWTIGPYRDIA